MFIGNRDRFAPWMTPDEFGFGRLMITLKAVMNPGNVFLALTAHNMFKPIGLDYLDPYNYFKEMDRTLVDVEQEQGRLWPGRAVAEREHRKRFAKHIIRDLELLLSPHHKNFLTTKLGFDSATAPGARHEAGLPHDRCPGVGEAPEQHADQSPGSLQSLQRGLTGR